MDNLKNKIIEASQIIDELDALFIFIWKEEVGDPNHNEILINTLINIKQKYKQKFKELIKIYDSSSQKPAVFYIDDDQALWAKKKNLGIDNE